MKKIKILFDTYFKKGGCQLMVTVVDHGVLEDAQKHPEKYPDLIVRVAGAISTSSITGTSLGVLFCHP